MLVTTENKKRILNDIIKFQKTFSFNFIKAAKIAINHYYADENWLVGHLVQEAGMNNSMGYYITNPIITKSGKAIEGQMDDNSIVYIPINKTINDGKVYFIPFIVEKTANNWTKSEIGTKYLGS